MGHGVQRHTRPLSGLWNHSATTLNLMPHALRVVRRSEYFASGSGEHFWRSLSAVLMDAAPVLATQKRSDRPLEDPGGPCRAWIESDVKGGSLQAFSSTVIVAH